MHKKWVKGSPMLFWRCGATHREWMSPAPGMGNVVLHIFYWYCNVWINCWPLQKFKPIHVLSSRIFMLQKGRLRAIFQNGSPRNFERWFLHTLQKIQHSKFFVFNNSVVSKKAHQSKTLFLRWDELGSLGPRGSSLTLNLTATNPENNATVFVWHPKTLFQNFRSSCFGWESFSGKKILEGCSGRFSCLHNGQKLVSTSL